MRFFLFLLFFYLYLSKLNFVIMKNLKHYIAPIMIYIIGMVAGMTLGVGYDMVISYLTMLILFIYVPQITKNEEIINDLNARVEFLEKLQNGNK